MNLTLLGLILKLITVLPKITTDVEGAMHKIEGDTDLAERLDDALKALSVVLDDVLKAVG